MASSSSAVTSDKETVKEDVVVVDAEVPGPSKKPEITGARLAYGLVRQYPENFDHVRYLKFLKESVIQSAKEEVEIANLISPFYNSLPSFNKSKTVRSPDTPVPHVHLDAEGIKNVEFKTLEMKVKATVSAVMVDNHCPKPEHLLFLRALNQLIVDLLAFFGSKRVAMKKLLKLATVALDHLFNCNLVKNSAGEEYQCGLEDSGVEYMLNHLVDFIIRDFKGACDQMFKSDIVETVIGFLKPTPIRRRLFELFATGIKTCLSHIHRGDRNTKNHGVLPMMYVETLFRYLSILETIVAMLPYIKESELGTLECIERTVAGSLKYPLISIFIARIATLAANLPRTPTPLEKRNTGLIVVRDKTNKSVKAINTPEEDDFDDL